VSSLEIHKQAEITSRTPEFMANEASKPFGWESYHWVRWATIVESMQRIGVPRGARVLDVGCGPGWTSLFLAESGYRVTATDIVPANVELTTRRAERWGVELSAQVADMEEVDVGGGFDLVLVYDALHHSTRHRQALAQFYGQLVPGGWLLAGETSWLHLISRGARRQSRESGWMERGFTARGLRRDLLGAGFVETRRFFGPTQPYASRGREFAYQLARLVLANVLVAPGTPIWIAARRDESGTDPARRGESKTAPAN
jgi:SAM-dependent methyltransferase